MTDDAMCCYAMRCKVREPALDFSYALDSRES